MTIVGEAFVAISPVGTGFASKLESQLKAAGLDNVGLAVGAGIAGGVIVGLGAIGQAFQKERQQIQQETGATGAQLTGLANTATQAFREVPVSLGNAATAVDELYRRGIPLGPQLDKLAEQELFLAKITKEDLGANVEATTGLMQRFNVPLGDQSRELDVLFRAYQASGQSFSTLTSNLQTGGAVLQQFGFNLDQSAALVAGLEKASVNLQPALAGLRLAFGKITSEGGNPKAALAALFKEFTDGTPRTVAASDAIKLFGTRSGAELTVAIEKGTLDISKLMKVITDGKGGIIETGLATLTLGDQFKLLRNNVEADLSGLGTTVLQDFESFFAAASGPVESLIGSVGHLVVALGPGAAELAIFLAPLKLALPVISDVAVGIDTIAGALDHLPAPIRAAVVLVGGLAIGVQLLGGTILASATAVGVFAAAIDFATGPIGLVIGGLTLLGVVARGFSSDGAIVSKTAKDIGTALFDAQSQTSVFNAGISSARQGLQQFFESEAQAGKIKGDLKSVLTDSGTAVTGLASTVNLGSDAWDKYRDSLVAAALKNEGFTGFNANSEQAQFRARGLTSALDEQRDAFVKSAKSELDDAVAAGQLTGAQERHLESTNRNRDGTINYGSVLDALNVRLEATAVKHDKVTQSAVSTQDAESKLAQELAKGAITDAQAKTALQGLGLSADTVTTELDALKAKAIELNQVQDAQVNKTLTTTAAYGDLARQVATGSIVQADAVTKLEGMGLSADGASTAFTDLQSSISSFVTGALSQIPTVGTAITDFSQTLVSDQSKLQSDVTQSGTLHERLNNALASNAASTQTKLAAVNLSISQDQAKIASGTVSTTDKLQTDLQRRSTIISGSGKASLQLQQDIAKNNAAITADYKNLADDNDPNRFTQNILKNAENVAKFSANLQTLVREGFGPLAGQLAQEGPTVAGGLAAGLASDKSKAQLANTAQILSNTTSAAYKSFLEQKFPELTNTGNSAGLQIGKGIADGIVQELDRLIPGLLPEVNKSGSTVGTTFANSTAGAMHKTLGQINLSTDGTTVGTTFANAAAGAIHGTLDDINTSGRQLGADLDAGVAKGIDDNHNLIGDALHRVARFGVNVANQAFGVSSPSKVMAVVGGFIAEGLAVGISGGAQLVGDAATSLAVSVSAGVQRSDPSSAFIEVGRGVGQSLATGVTASSGDVSAAASRLVSHLTASTSVTLPAPLIETPTIPKPVIPAVDPVVVPAPVVPKISIPVPVVPAPTIPTLRFPVPTIPAPVVPTVHFSTPVVPDPLVPTVSISTPTIGRPVIPAPEIPPISISTPSVGRPVVPVPSVPSISIPTPVIGQPLVPRPVVPAPAVPEVVVHATVPRPVVPEPLLPSISISAPTIPRPVVPTPTVPSVSVPAIVIPAPTVGQPVVPTPEIPTISISAPVVGRPIVPTPIVPSVKVPVSVAAPVVPAPKLDAKLTTFGPDLSKSIQQSVTLSSTSIASGLNALSGQVSASFGTESFVGIGEKVGLGITAGIQNTSGLSKEVTAKLVQEILATLEAGLESPTQKKNLLKLLNELGAPALRIAPTTPSDTILNRQANQSLQVPAPQDRADAQAQQNRARGLFDGAKIVFPKDADPVHIANTLAWKFLT